MIRLSGLVSSRPAAGAAKNARFYATDENIIYFSTGGSWQAGWPLDQNDVVGTFSLPLGQRPASSTSIGWIFIDSGTGDTYEAFPDAWAPILEIPTQHDVVRVEGSGAPSNSAQAALTTSLAGSNNDLVFTAVPIGALGNLITVRYLNPGAPSVALSAAILGNAITVTLATNGSSVITSTAAQIAALSALASLVTVANAGGNNGSGVVTAMAATPLVSGVTGSGAGIAGKGSTYVDYASGSSYNNTGTKAAPTWVASGGSGSIASTANLIKGDGAGAGVDSGILPANVVQKQTGFATPTTVNELVSCLQAAGLCAAIIFFFSFLAGVPSASATNFGDITRTTDVATLWAPAVSQQTVGDADATWLPAKDFLIATAAMTASRANTMPAANSAIAGTRRVFVDKVTSTSSTFVRSFVAAGSDTITNAGGASSSYAPAAGSVAVEFETDGVSNWTVIWTASQPAFTDMRDKLTDGQAALLVKPACAVVATSNLTLSGEQTIDGQLTSASLVLATSQTTGSQNGPWVSASGAWTRPTWYSSGSTVQAPRFLTTFVRLGTSFSGSTWRMTTASVTIDTTTTTWVQTPVAVNSTSVSNGVTGSGAVVLAVSPFLTGHVTMENVTSTGATGSGKQVYDTSPLFPSGIDLGNTDSTLTRSTAGIPAVEGLDLPPHYIIRAASTVTQANDASAHAIFTTPANGRFTAPLTGKYKFRGRFSWTSMSATNGNVKVDILGAGTATVINWHWRAMGQDGASGTQGANLSGAWFVTSASGVNAVSAATQTACFVEVGGDFEVTVVGTLIPTQTMHDAAAAVLSVGSQLEIWREGATGLTSTGPWD